MARNLLTHALLDLQGGISIPGSVSAQGLREVKKFRVVQIRHHPVRHLGSVPVENLVALRVLLPNGAVG